MRGRFFLLGLILAISIIVAARYLTRPLPQTPPLVVTTDKEVYIQGENVRVTVKNVSENRISLWVTGRFEKHDGVAWMFYKVSEATMYTDPDLGPGEEKHVVFSLRDFPQGRYRTSIHGRWEEGKDGKIHETEAYAEFVVHPENLLIVTTDKKIYLPAEEIKVTVKNISYHTLFFGSLYFGLVFERWDGTAWQYYHGMYEPAMVILLGPGEEGHVTHVLMLDSGEGFAPGTYRVKAGAGYFVNGEPRGTTAYAEFEVREPLVGSLVLTTDKEVYLQGESMRIAVKNATNVPLIFGNSAYDLSLKRRAGAAWLFYGEIVGDAVATYLHPNEEARVTYELKNFLPGRYRVGTSGTRVEDNEVYPLPWAYAEFEVRAP